jgi:type IV secretion system protein VirB3
MAESNRPHTLENEMGNLDFDGPEQTIMRTSLSRPQQLLGGDRELVIMAGLGTAMMAVTVMSFLSFLIAIIAFWTIVAVLARIGKADPMMRKVYSRHLGYKDFYPAKSGVTAFGKTPKRGWR